MKWTFFFFIIKLNSLLKINFIQCQILKKKKKIHKAKTYKNVKALLSYSYKQLQSDYMQKQIQQ